MRMLFLAFCVILITGLMHGQETHTMMKLGTATQITIGTRDLGKSLAFYKKLGFEEIASDTVPYPWTQVSDGTILILLDETGQEYIGLTYFAKDMDKKIVDLERMGVSFVRKTHKDGKFFQGIFSSPDSLWVSLINDDHTGMYQPRGQSLRDFPQEDHAKPEKYPNRKCGVFGAFSHPVKNLEESIAFWKQLGFDALGINQQPYPWAILTDGMNILGLHETKDFSYPAITYFAPDMAARVKRLEEEGIDSIKQFGGSGGGPGNVVVTTPEGQKFFLFSL